MIWVGTSGYAYPEWRGSFYPRDFPEPEMLPFYSRHFRTVEINYTSYHFPTEKNLIGWAEATPPEFKLALKVPRRITYGPAAQRAQGPLRAFYERACALGSKLGPLLMQLPPGYGRDDDVLARLVAAAPRGAPTSIELRDASWHADEVFATLREHNVGLCISDSEELTTPVVRTADVVYLRLRHEGYLDADLARWASHVHDLAFSARDVFVYFKHEGTGSGPRYAATLLEHLGGAHG